MALVACFVAGDVVLSPAIELGGRMAATWGVVPALVLTGFGLAALFTVVHDGPRALRGLLDQSQPRRRNMA
ncbi:MAG TPA: hypothetical protein VHF27_05100 [Acidimicrobiales bacterium]|nr:hypothetical protein [Acidimicrobiales bacterium]